MEQYMYYVPFFKKTVKFGGFVGSVDLESPKMKEATKLVSSSLRS